MSKTPRPRRRKREQVHDVIAQSPDHPTLKIEHIFDQLGAALDAANRTTGIARRLPEGSLSTELLEQVRSASLALSQLQDSLHLLRDTCDPALLQTYQKIGDDLFAARSPSEVGNAALPTLCRLVGCDWAFVALAEPTPEYSTLLSLYENEEESQKYIPPLWELVEALSRELLSVASPKTPFVYSNNRPIESPRKPDEIARILRAIQATRAKSFLGVTLQTEDELIGYLGLGWAKRDSIEQDWIISTRSIAERIGRLLEQALIRDELSERLKRLTEITQLGNALHESNTPESTIRLVFRSLQELFDIDRGAIIQISESDSSLHATHLFGIEREEIHELAEAVGLNATKDWLTPILSTSRPYLAYSRGISPKNESEGATRLAGPSCALPLQARGKVIGIIWLLREERDGQPRAQFPSDEVSLMGLFSHTAGLALENARLREQVGRMKLDDSASG